MKISTTLFLAILVAGCNQSDSSNPTWSALGDKAVIYYTEDGAQTWSTRRIATNTLYDLAFLGNHYVAVGTDGMVHRTTDGGDTWSIVRLTSKASLYAIASSLVLGHGVAVGDSGIVMATVDEGETWNEQRVNDAVKLTSVATELGRTLATGVNGRVYRSIGGTSYAAVDVSTQSLHGVALDQEQNAIVVGAAGAWRSTNAGLTWEGPNVFVPLTAVAFSYAGEAIAVGPIGMIYRTTDFGNTWARISSPVTTNLHDITFSVGLWTIVGKGVVLRSSDGVSWQSSSPSIDRDIRGIEMLDNIQGIAVGPY